MLVQTGNTAVCTPEQYKDCADPALGERTHLFFYWIKCKILV